MNPVPDNLILRFAEEFASARNGFKLDEIPAYFAQYQGNVPTLRSYIGSVTKPTAFKDCVLALSPENQRQALYDLCDCPPQATHPMPDSGRRQALLVQLVQADGMSPLSVTLSAVALSGIRSQWMTAASRLPQQPSAAVTAARALLESTCKTILHELNEVPDSSGDLGRLYKQVRASLGIDSKQGASQAVYQMVNGLIQCVAGGSEQRRRRQTRTGCGHKTGRRDLGRFVRPCGWYGVPIPDPDLQSRDQRTEDMRLANNGLNGKARKLAAL